MPLNRPSQTSGRNDCCTSSTALGLQLIFLFLPLMRCQDVSKNDACCEHGLQYAFISQSLLTNRTQELHQLLCTACCHKEYYPQGED